MQRNKLLPPVYLLLSLIVMVGLWSAFPVMHIIPTPWNLLGLVPLALGIALNVMADGLFHKSGTTVRPGEQSTVLVTDGPFRLSRNPMYLGFVLILSGVAFILGALTPFVVIPVFVILIDQRFIRMEEAMLSTTFGAAWQAYMKQTRRWI